MEEKRAKDVGILIHGIYPNIHNANYQQISENMNTRRECHFSGVDDLREFEKCYGEYDYLGLFEDGTFLIFPKSKDMIDDSIRRSAVFEENRLTDELAERFCLNNEAALRRSVCSADIVLSRANEEKVTVEEYYKTIYPAFYHKILPACKSVLKRDFSTLLPYYNSYMEDRKRIPFFSFVMTSALTEDFSRIVLCVVEEVEKCVDISKFTLNELEFRREIAITLLGAYGRMKSAEKFRVYQRFCLHLLETSIEMTDIAPVFGEKSVNIVLSSSDFFAPYLGVCIRSLIATTTEKRNYDIIVVERGISEDNKRNILKIAVGHKNISIRFYNVAAKMKKYNFFINSPRLSQETYYGLLMPWLLPMYDKAIIMDCDMIVKHDVAELFDEGLEENIAGGVNDVILQGWLNDPQNDTYDYYSKQLKILNPYKCFNGGLVLLDFEKYRRSVTPEQVGNYIDHYQLRVVDQDIFNIILEGRAKLIDVRWNHMVYLDGAISESIKKAPAIAQHNYFESRKAPYIIHFASENKPWLNPEIEFATEFWEHARQTPFYEIILKRMVSAAQNGSTTTNGQIDTRTGARKFADKLLPKGSRRRKFAKKLLPKGSLRWRFCKQIYYVFKPQYRPKR